MGGVPGWPDGDLFSLLELLRAHLWDYIYRSSEEFARIVCAALPGRQESDVLEAVRAVMEQFAVAFNTRNMRGQVLRVHDSQVFVHEYIYETIKLVRENRSGGVWLPDELVRFLKKIKQYKALFKSKPSIFFTRIQLWGKSVDDTKNKFYALREMYHIEKPDNLEVGDSVSCARLQALAELFDDVPSAPPREESTAPPSKFTSKLWSPEDLEVIIDLLVRITREIQQTGTSPLVRTVATKLGRSEGSCVNKLQDMRERFLNKESTTHRAANLPAIIYDTTSDANKIFNADWSDPNDTYAVGFLALKYYFNRVVGKKKKATIPVPTFRNLRASVRNNSQSDEQVLPSKQSSNPTPRYAQSRPSRIDIDCQELDFVQEVASTCGWTQKLAVSVLALMQQNLSLYQQQRMLDFFKPIAMLIGDAPIAEVFTLCSRVLKSFEQRFGSLSKLATMSFGDGYRNHDFLTPNTQRGGAIRREPSFVAQKDDSLHNGLNQRGADSPSSELDEQRGHTVDPGSEYVWENGGDVESLDSIDRTSSTSSYSKYSMDSDSNSNPRKRYRGSSLANNRLCMSCHNRLEESPDSEQSTADGLPFGKNMSSMNKNRQVIQVRRFQDEDEQNDADGDGADDDDGDEDEENGDQGSQSDVESEPGEVANDFEVSDSNSVASDADSESDNDTITEPPLKRFSPALQSLLRSVEARVNTLEAKNRELIERQESRDRVEQLVEGALRQERQVS